MKVCYAGVPCPTIAGATVTRQILDDSRVHPAIRARIADEGRAVIAEVEAAVASNAVVVVGMAWNPFPTKARKCLQAAAGPYKYIESGNYLSQWRARLPLKLWTGWTTFPMIFVDGQFIGGFNDLAKLGSATLKGARGGRAGAPRPSRPSRGWPAPRRRPRRCRCRP